MVLWKRSNDIADQNQNDTMVTKKSSNKPANRIFAGHAVLSIDVIILWCLFNSFQKQIFMSSYFFCGGSARNSILNENIPQTCQTILINNNNYWLGQIWCENLLSVSVS